MAFRTFAALFICVLAALVSGSHAFSLNPCHSEFIDKHVCSLFRKSKAGRSHLPRDTRIRRSRRSVGDVLGSYGYGEETVGVYGRHHDGDMGEGRDHMMGDDIELDHDDKDVVDGTDLDEDDTTTTDVVVDDPTMGDVPLAPVVPVPTPGSDAEDAPLAQELPAGDGAQTAPPTPVAPTTAESGAAGMSVAVSAGLGVIALALCL